jgi:hypothetical protein
MVVRLVRLECVLHFLLKGSNSVKLFQLPELL